MNPRYETFAFMIVFVDGFIGGYILDGALGKGGGFLGEERRNVEPQERDKDESGDHDHGPWAVQRPC